MKNNNFERKIANAHEIHTLRSVDINAKAGANAHDRIAVFSNQKLQLAHSSPLNPNPTWKYPHEFMIILSLVTSG
jgi:hypothetical protein